MICGYFRAGRRVSTSTHGRMLTTASLSSLTASASCSKLHSDTFLVVAQIPKEYLNLLLDSISHYHSFFPAHIMVMSHLSYFWCMLCISAPVRKSCQHLVHLKKRYELFCCMTNPDFDLACNIITSYHTQHMYVCLSSPQQKQQELERVEKWLKMVKNWDKYRNSDKVCNSAVTPVTHQGARTLRHTNILS